MSNDHEPGLLRTHAVTSGIVSLGCGAAAASRMPHSWDGAWYLTVLQEGEPFIPHGRLSAAVPQLPALLLGALGDTTRSWAFVIGYAAMPLVALTVLWLVARAPSPPGAYPLGVSGILLCALASQTFWVSEAVLSLQLGIPLTLAVVAAGATDRRRTTLLSALALLVLLMHPLGAVIVLINGVAFIRVHRHGSPRLSWLVGSVAVCAGSIRLLLSMLTRYERETGGPRGLQLALFGTNELPPPAATVAGIALSLAFGLAVLTAARRGRLGEARTASWVLGLLAVLAVGSLVAVARSDWDPPQQLGTPLAFVTLFTPFLASDRGWRATRLWIVATCSIGAGWALMFSKVEVWQWFIDARLAIPLYALAFIALSVIAVRFLPPLRDGQALAAAAIFASSLSVASITYAGARAEFRALLEDAPACVLVHDLDPPSPMWHWSATHLARLDGFDVNVGGTGVVIGDMTDDCETEG